jgi:hypothetical protein
MAARRMRWLAGFAAAGVVAVVGAGLVLYRLLPTNGRSPAPHDWTAEWRSAPPVVETLPGGLLETATIRMGEDFYKSDALTWWGVYLGNTVSHIQVAAVYRYGVPLNDDAWHLVTRGSTAVVVAPVLRPSLPVAVDTGTWREKTENGWARFDKQDQLDELRRGLSADLAARAADQARIALAREASRRTITEFVERWLLARETGWTPGLFSAVKVYFDDEIDGEARLELVRRRPPATR